MSILKPNQILHYLALKYEGDWDKLTQAVKDKEVPDEELYEKLSSA